MKENEKMKPNILVTEGNRKTGSHNSQDISSGKNERFKKPMIFGLMAIVFLGCLYMIFAPEPNKEQPEDVGINDAVPQATDAGLQADKQKAYEQELMEQKEREKKATLTALSDYWNTDSTETEQPDIEQPEEESLGNSYGRSQSKANAALNSYRNMQNTLGTFYEGNRETDALRKELEELKGQLAQKESPQNPMENQLKLMEKSYEMAAKYFPQTGDTIKSKTSAQGNTRKEPIEPVFSVKKQSVSSLYREPTNAEFLADWSQKRNRNFYTVGSVLESSVPKNSIRACVHDMQTVSIGSSVRLRLLESARVGNRIIPIGTLLTTTSVKMSNGRLMLQVTSMELEGSILPIDIIAYDLDGQQGLNVPYAPEMNALKEIASGMGTSTGTNIMLTSSPGQQLTADLSKGLIQGTSGYFSKKMNTPKITLKAGHQLFLVPKK